MYYWMILLLGVLTTVISASIVAFLIKYISFRKRFGKDYKFRISNKSFKILKDYVNKTKKVNKMDYDRARNVHSVIPFPIENGKAIFGVDGFESRPLYVFQNSGLVIGVVPSNSESNDLREVYRVFRLPFFRGLMLYLTLILRWRNRANIERARLEKEKKEKCEAAIVDLYTNSLD